MWKILKNQKITKIGPNLATDCKTIFSNKIAVLLKKSIDSFTADFSHSRKSLDVFYLKIERHKKSYMDVS